MKLKRNMIFKPTHDRTDSAAKNFPPISQDFRAKGASQLLVLVLSNRSYLNQPGRLVVYTFHYLKSYIQKRDPSNFLDAFCLLELKVLDSGSAAPQEQFQQV
jgi:hypothetical protein